MFTARFVAILLFSASLHAQMSALPGFGVTGGYPRPATEGPSALPLLTASADGPILGDVPAFPSDAKPITGVVSLRELEHPIPKKAIQEAFEAQKLSRHNEIPKAIAKLENALRLYPAYRDAHVNLGVQYARLGRAADARAEFQKGLAIGPPEALIYSDLALTSLALQEPEQADAFARKALELDPRNSAARRVLQFAPTH